MANINTIPQSNNINIQLTTSDPNLTIFTKPAELSNLAVNWPQTTDLSLFNNMQETSLPIEGSPSARTRYNLFNGARNFFGSKNTVSTTAIKEDGTTNKEGVLIITPPNMPPVFGFDPSSSTFGANSLRSIMVDNPFLYANNNLQSVVITCAAKPIYKANANSGVVMSVGANDLTESILPDTGSSGPSAPPGPPMKFRPAYPINVSLEYNLSSTIATWKCVVEDFATFDVDITTQTSTNMNVFSIVITQSTLSLRVNGNTVNTVQLPPEFNFQNFYPAVLNLGSPTLYSKSRTNYNNQHMTGIVQSVYMGGSNTPLPGLEYEAWVKEHLTNNWITDPWATPSV